VALRTATLRHDDDGQAGLICLLLRNYLDANLYEQASKLIARAAFPENASNNDWARYLYYLGRISAVQLQYADAHTHLEQALRKAPQNSAPGFIQAVCACLCGQCRHGMHGTPARVTYLMLTSRPPAPQTHKLLVIVQLLLGQIPDRATFRRPVLRRSLLPYRELTQGMHAMVPIATPRAWGHWDQP
jgi:26S proteasome regulatory subunit N3